MQKILIASSTAKSIKDFTDILSFNRDYEISSVSLVSELLQKVAFGGYDIVIINLPLKDAKSNDFLFKLSEKCECQEIVIAPQESLFGISERAEELGIFVVAKPISENLFWTTVRLATAAANKSKRLKSDNDKLIEKIASIRLVDRAKWCLVEKLSMTEDEAHKYIEKRAMDLRIPKKEVAEAILKTYEE